MGCTPIASDSMQRRILRNLMSYNSWIVPAEALLLDSGNKSRSDRKVGVGRDGFLKPSLSFRDLFPESSNSACPAHNAESDLSPQRRLDGQQILPGEALGGGLAQQIGRVQGGDGAHRVLADGQIPPLPAQPGDSRIGL